MMVKMTYTVVVADDDELDTHLTRRAIAQSLPNAEILAFENGLGALDHIRSVADGPEEGLPKLVLMDFRMPKMGCMDLIVSLNRPDVLNKIPFVLFSSSVGPTDVDRCLVAGIRAYVEKPTDPLQYGDAVAGICERYGFKSDAHQT